MKSIELRKVPCGEIFTVFGEEYVVLEHVDGGVLSIRKEIWKNAVFDRMGNSRLSEANILEDLDDYLNLLKSNGMKDGDTLPQMVDLKATDGTRVYGYHECTVALLTLEQYGKYKEIIPKVEGWWWLATPVWTRWLRSPYTSDARYVFCVYSRGVWGDFSADGSYGVRPVLNFSSCLLVSWLDGEDEGGKDESDRKEERWGAYIAYLEGWSKDNAETGCYGLSPLGFDEWLEEKCEEDEDDVE